MKTEEQITALTVTIAEWIIEKKYSSIVEYVNINIPEAEKYPDFYEWFLEYISYCNFVDLLNDNYAKEAFETATNYVQHILGE